ncbi:hypothetical protein EYF80_020777 [Liparis tanakae]|uniref:Uncharacterized protein n=1 Tax=Liparis tanakae TaxID=230148 RepID=A0A4Z2HSS7_9TELE|nr:hypothetical protein EYF80_020777 [Liparis tanakae]
MLQALASPIAFQVIGQAQQGAGCSPRDTSPTHSWIRNKVSQQMSRDSANLLLTPLFTIPCAASPPRPAPFSALSTNHVARPCEGNSSRSQSRASSVSASSKKKINMAAHITRADIASRFEVSVRRPKGLSGLFNRSRVGSGVRLGDLLEDVRVADITSASRRLVLSLPVFSRHRGWHDATVTVGRFQGDEL